MHKIYDENNIPPNPAGPIIQWMQRPQSIPGVSPGLE